MENPNEQFRCEHLFASSKNLQAIKAFRVDKRSGKGLERYLKQNAVLKKSINRIEHI